MPVTVTVSRDSLMDLGRLPSGPLHVHWLKLGATVDRKAKLNLSNDMVHVRTGNLRSSQQVPTIQVLGSLLTLQAVNIAKYAKWVHDGTRPHEIRAKHTIASGPRAGQPGYLRFTASTGDIVFAQSVQHPGTTARPWLLKALTETLAERT